MVIGLFTRYQLERGPSVARSGMVPGVVVEVFGGLSADGSSFGRGFVHGSLQSK